MRRHALGICPEERGEGQRLAGLYVKPAAVGGQHAADRLADGLVVIEVEDRQRLRGKGDTQAVPAMLRDALIQLALEPIQIPRPAAEAIGEAAPVGGAALEAAVRHEVLHALGGDLREPFLATGRFGQHHVVEPQCSRAFEPELQPAGSGGKVLPGPEQEVESLPLRSRRQELLQPGILPSARITQSHLDRAAPDAFSLGPACQPIPLSLAHADLADLADHGMEVRPVAVELGAG